MKHVTLRTFLAAILTTAVLTAGVVSVRAEDKKPDQPKPANKKETSGFFPFVGVVKAVDVAKKTITLPGAKGKPDRVFHVIDTTKLQNDGKAIKLEDIQPGQQVGGRAKQSPEGKNEASTVNIQPKKAPKP